MDLSQSDQSIPKDLQQEQLKEQQKELQQRARRALIQNKGKRPVFAAHFLSRSFLIEQAFQQQDIVWLNCAAGYGKTLLMAEYLMAGHCEQQVDVAWFRCDDRDASADDFIQHLLEVCESQISGIASLALSHWQMSLSQHSADADQTLLLWLEELARLNRPLLICLDDIHLLQNDAVQGLLGRLLSERPENVKLLLAGRYLPSLSGRVRLQQNIAWLNSQQLTFSDDQVQRFLMHNGIDQAGRLVPSINTRLQGWPAGLSLWLACYRALGKPAEPPALLAQLEMSDYLQGETLHALTPELQQFIQQAAVLGQFNESLLQYCLAELDTHALLQQALAQNLFIEAVHGKPGWYRLHPVMADLLRQRLAPQQRQRLNSQAYDLLKDSNERIAALYHAKEAGLSEQVIPWVEEQAEYFIGDMDIAAMLEWLEGVGDTLLRRSSRLMLVAAWTWLFTQQRDKALPLMDELIADHALPDYDCAALRGYLARLDGNLKYAEEQCKFALEHLPPERFTVRILMSTTLSLSCLVNNDIDGARIWNRFAQDLSRQYQVPVLEAQVLFDYGRIELNRGHIQCSLDVVDQGLTLLTDNHNNGISLGRLLSYKAFLNWLLGNNRAELVDMMQQAIAASTRCHDSAVCYGYGFLAMAKAEMSHFDQALELLDQAERLMQRWQVGVSNYQWLDVIKANVWISQGKLARAQRHLDEFTNLHPNSAQLRPEMFPMLPGFIVATRLRLHLKANRPQQCISEADQWLRTTNQNLMSIVVMMFRAAALRSEKPQEGEAQLRQLQQILDREGVRMDFHHWIPNLLASDTPTLAPAGSGGNAMAEFTALSERELEVLRKIDQGLSNQEIADLLFISLHTVKTHARKINVKLGAKSRTQALHRAKELLLI
ncbi:LuxR C-terminal-related transcriptional regulator [Bacterioplanoides sp.]|uniref:LuxR C-terminal-related transcriptional regulator n=1 Tax=Bacterioplanoides sp. TaxID=2066072 RepID=UPI003B00B5BB